MGRKDISNIRKPEILKHVYEVIKSEGLQGTTLSKIAERMGVNSSLLIHYFKTKDDILLALTESIIEKYLKYLYEHIQIIEKINDPEERLDTILDAMFDPDWDRVVDAEVFYACFYMSFQNRRISKRIKKLYSNFKEEMAKEIEKHFGNNQSSREKSEQAAIAIIALLEGYGYYRAATGNQAPNGEYLEYIKKIAKKTLKVEFKHT